LGGEIIAPGLEKEDRALTEAEIVMTVGMFRKGEEREGRGNRYWSSFRRHADEERLVTKRTIGKR